METCLEGKENELGNDWKPQRISRESTLKDSEIVLTKHISWNIGTMLLSILVGWRNWPCSNFVHYQIDKFLKLAGDKIEEIVRFNSKLPQLECDKKLS